MRYAALGDSYTAGEGIGPYEPDSDTPTNGCHRSLRSFPSLVQAPGTGTTFQALALADPLVYGYELPACSGAVSSNVLPPSLGGVPQYDEGATQLGSGVVTSTTTHVSVTIGGNDAGFDDVLLKCALNDCVADGYKPYDNQRFVDWLPAHIDSIQPRLVTTYQAIRTAGPNARVVVAGYPQLFPDTLVEQLCPSLANFYAPNEQTFVRQMGDRLNQVISRAATTAGVGYRDVRPAFAGHEVCGSAGEWISGPVLSGGQYDIFAGSFHPNQDGAVALATEVSLAFAQ